MKLLASCAIAISILVSAVLDDGPPQPEWQSLFINPYIQREIFTNCKKYAESVYMDQLQGMAMMHPDAQGKEETAREIAKDSFIECYRPYKKT